LEELLPRHSEYMLNFYEIVQLFIPEASIFYKMNAVQGFLFKSESHLCKVHCIPLGGTFTLNFEMAHKSDEQACGNMNEN